MKTSYNHGADLMACLSAIKTGSTNCTQGQVAAVKTITGLGAPDTSVFPQGGAGGGVTLIVLGMVSTGRRALATAQRNGARLATDMSPTPEGAR